MIKKPALHKKKVVESFKTISNRQTFTSLLSILHFFFRFLEHYLMCKLGRPSQRKIELDDK